MARPRGSITRYEDGARLGMAEMAMFLSPTTLAVARENGPRPRRSATWWARAVTNGEKKGLLVSPGKGPLWWLTFLGRWQVERWMAKQKAAA